MHDADPLHQIGRSLGGGRRQLDGAGVRRRGRERPQPDRHAHPPRRGQADDGISEGLPVEIGLGAHQVQHVSAGTVVAVADHRLGPRQLGGHPVDDVGHRSACPLVQEVPAVESDERRRRALAQEGGDGGGGAQPRIDPALERDHQDGAFERRLAVGGEDLGQPVGTHEVASSASAAIWASEATWAGKASTLRWSPAPAPAT